MISTGRYETSGTAPFPGLAIAVVSLMANLLGDWLRDWIDPRLRHARR